ncbi:ABC transporter permease [Streptomyces sp. NPDC096057]|uniref:ABC transporter permease n=1 Tax=Streptomyces sp. NPDC096057 TaxID=3155543 RepID=UPI00332F362E
MTQTFSPAPEQAALHQGARVTQVRVLRSEWTKFRSLRSTTYTMFTAVAIFIGGGVLFPWIRANQSMTAQERATFDPTDAVFSSAFMVQLVIAVLGVLLMSGEYATGLIRATFSTVPRRLPVLWAKATVFAVVGMGLLTATAFIVFFAGQSMLASANLDVSLSDPGSIRVVLGSAFYLTMVGLLGLAMGALLRSAAGGIGAMIGVLVGTQLVTSFLPSGWQDNVNKYLLTNALDSLIKTSGDLPSSALSTGGAIAVVLAWVVPFFGFAAASLVRRDA